MYVAAIDIGGTNLKSALYSGAGEELLARRRPTGRHRGPDAVVAEVLDAAEEITALGASRFGTPPAALGLASLGRVDEANGVALASGAIGWNSVALRELAAQRTGLPTVLGHDLRAGALAEGRFGAAKNCRSFLFIAVGTGIGSAIVLDGRPHPGARWVAGEVGHVVIEPQGQPCRCGARGCLEAEASGTAIAYRYREKTGFDLTAREIADLASEGDVAASEVWRTTVQRLARGICIASTLLDPDVVVVGGGVSLAGEALFDPLREELGRDFRLGEPPGVLPSGLGDRSACLGAAIMALDLVERTTE